MNKNQSILITGGGGEIGRLLNYHFLQNGYTDVLALTHQQLDVLNSSRVNLIFNSLQPDVIIHCAIKGGRRTREDNVSIVYENLLGFENVIGACSKFIPNSTFINFATGAEFNSKYNIDITDTRFESIDFVNEFPSDYYGFSKRVITNRLRGYKNRIGKIFNLRSFNVFSQFESSDRFITTCINNALQNRDIQIFEDKYFTFFSGDNLFSLIDFFIQRSVFSNYIQEINLSNNEIYLLSEVAQKIVALTNSKSQIIINSISDKNYIGRSSIIDDIIKNNSRKQHKLNLDCLDVGLSKMVSYIQNKTV